MLQTASHSIQPAAGANQSLEDQKRPGVYVERIDPTVLALISFLFTYQFEGMEFLALLCQRATEKQFAMFEQSIAVITFHGIATLCKSPDWKWGYHATLRYFIIFEALGILTRLRRNRTTEVHIPLGQREKPLNRTSLLQSLDNLQKKKQEKHAYKDKKMLQLIERVRSHIEIYSIDDAGDSQIQQRASIDQVRLVSLQARLISVMRAERIPLAKCKRIVQWMCSDQIPGLLREYIHAALPLHNQVEQQGTSGDSKDLAVLTEVYSEGDSQNGAGDSQNTLFSLQLEYSSEISTQNRPQKTQNSVASTLTEQSKLFALAPSEGLKNEMGDSEERLSSNISILNKKISNKDRSDIEKVPVIVSSESPNPSILAEATWIAIELDGKESLKLNRGKGWIGAYKKKLEENPYLVRVSMIDMFLQRFFPDWQGPPQGRGGPWFNRAYKAYVLQEMSVSPEVESWARSLFSYKQIKKALLLERQRQKQVIKEIQRRSPFSTETFQRPFADCVEVYGLLHSGQASTPASEMYNGPFIQEEPLVEQSEVHVDVTKPGVVIEMEDGSCLSQEEYEQLEARAREEENHRIEALLSDQSLEASDMLREYFEQWVTMGLSALPIHILDDVQKLQAILNPERYTVEVLFTTAIACVINVRANDDPGNMCLLTKPEQTNAFIHRFSHFPTALLSDVEQLRTIVDPKMYIVEILLEGRSPYVINVRAMKNPSNACRLESPGQVRAFIRWLHLIPAVVLDDLQHLGTMLNPKFYTVSVALALAERYVIGIWANEDPTNFRLLEGPDQTQEFIAWFTQREAESVGQSTLEEGIASS